MVWRTARALGYCLIVAYAMLLCAPVLGGSLVECDNLSEANNYCRVSENGDCCGADLSNMQVALNLSATGSDASVDTNLAGGDLTCCMYTGDTPPTVEQIDANSSPCVQKRAITVSAAGSVSFTSANRFDALTEGVGVSLACYQNTDGARPLVEVLTSMQFEPKDPAEQESNTLIAVEAEDPTFNVTQDDGDTWTSVSPANASGTAMQVLPDDGTSNTATFTSTAPRLDFALNFANTGTHYLWVRGASVDSQSDSVHAGLNGSAVATADNIGWFNTSFDWSNLDFDSERITLSIPSTGQHTVNFWAREDGFILDRFLLTTDADYVPTGLGPDASPSVDVVATPVLTASRSFATTMDVTMSTTTSGATIYYTTDGSTPDDGDTEYTAPVTITNTTTVKAIATKADYADSSVATATYTETGGADLTGRSDVYYVRADVGSDAAAGTSYAAAWRTLAKVNSTVSATSSKVCLFGEFENQTLTMDWDGVAGDTAWAATCYESGGAVYRYDQGPSPKTADADKAQIDGTWEPDDCNPATLHANQSSGDCTAAWPTGNPDAVPSVWYQALVSLKCSYCEFRGVKVIGSAWGGIEINEGAQGNEQPLDHVWIEDNVVKWSAKIGILAVDAHHIYIRRNHVYFTDTCRAQQQWGGAQCYHSSTLLNYGAGVRCGDSLNSFCLIEENVVHDTYGEQISVTLGTRHIVRGNVAFRGVSNPFYGNSTGSSIWAGNIAMGLPHDGKSFTEANDSKEGFGVGSEATWADPLNAAASGDLNVFINNLYAGGRECLAVSNLSSAAANSAHPDQGAFFYRNTCVVDGDEAVRVSGDSGALGNVRYESNLFSTNASATCSVLPGVVFGKNGWTASASQVANACESGSDVFNASVSLTITPANWESYVPDWAAIEAAGGWQAWKAANTELWTLFQMATGDDGSTDGVDLRATTHPTLDHSNWSGLMSELTNLNTSDVTYSNCLAELSENVGDDDFHCAAVNATTPLGAIQVLK